MSVNDLVPRNSVPGTGALQSRHRLLSTAILNAVIAVVIAVPQTATAHAAVADAAPQAEERKGDLERSSATTTASPAPISIPAGTLADALDQLAKQTGADLVYRPEQVTGLKTAGVTGRLPISDAINKLLEGTELRLSTNAAGAYLIAVPKTTAVKTSADDARGVLDFRLAAGGTSQNTESAAIKKSAASSDESDPPKSDTKVQEIVVTAQKREERLQDVPIAITVLSGADLDSSTFTNFTDALRTLPGVDNNVDQYTGGMMLSVRGVSTSRARGYGASPVAYYIDGVPYGFVRSAVVPGGGNVYDLERIEFLAGPQGTLYGANALNGVLRVLTKDPVLDAFDFKSRASFSTTDGGEENFGGDVALNVPLIEGKLALRGVVGYRKDAGWIDGPNGENLNNATSRNYRIKLKAQPTETLSVGLSAWRTDKDLDAPDYSDDNQRISALEDQSGAQEFSVYALNIEQEFSVFTVSSVSSYMDYEALGTVSGESIPAPVTLDTVVGARVFSEELNLVSTLEGSWRWSAGAYYRNAKDSYFQNLFFIGGAIGPFIQDDYTDSAKSWAVYGEVGRKFVDDRLDVGVGLRYYRDEQALRLKSQYFDPPLLGSPFESESDAVTPRVVATWLVSPQVTVYGSYAQGFRGGAVQVPDVQVVFPNFKPVEPDKLSNYEIGSKGTVAGGSLSYTASVFYIDWQDIQQSLAFLLPNGVTGTAAMLNAGSASGIGAEFSVSTRPFQGLDLGVNVSWNDLAFDSDVFSGTQRIFGKGDRLTLSPEYTVGGFIEYSRPLSGGFTGRIAYGADYKSPQDIGALDTPTTSQSILMQHARLSVEALAHWSVSLYADNLGNEKNSPTPVAVPAEFSPRFRPRTIGIMFDYHY